jgi:hypothetical protein
MFVTEKKVILHVGLPKTATSYLQSFFFPSLNDVYIVGRGGGESGAALEFVYQDFIDIRKKRIEIGPEKRRQFTNALKKIKENNIVFSYEGLAGSAMIDTDKSTFDDYCQYIEQVIGRCEIVLCIRRQDTWLASMYHQRVKKGYYLNFNTFINYEKGEFLDYRFTPFSEGRFGKGVVQLTHNNKISMSVPGLNYMNIVNKFKKVPCINKVFVVPFENLDKILEVFGSMGIELDSDKLSLFKKSNRMNVSHSKYVLIFYRLFNFLHMNIFLLLGILVNDKNFLYKLHRRVIGIAMRFQDKFDLFLIEKKLYKTPSFLSNLLQNKILEQHNASNKELSKKYNLDLKSYGYYHD